MTTKTLSKSDLAQFTCSENWYRHGINRNVFYTDGAHVAEHGGAYWLLDEIAIIQLATRLLPPRNFKSGRLLCVSTEPLRLHATMATAISCLPRRSSTRISH